jgi:shikimate dehydrogenase
MIQLAVFGSPVAHSLSPRIHRRFARQCGLDVEYRAFEATAEDFAEQVRTLAECGARGCNVTVPFKQAAWRLAARCSDGATRARAANTLVFDAPGDWYADNTDGPGLVDDLRGPLGRDLSGSRVCLLGAGGAAAGVLAALLAAGVARLSIANRTAAPARDLAARHADLGRVEARTPKEIGTAAPFDLLINATSMGHLGAAPAIEPVWLAPGGLCYDLNYGKAAEPLRQVCARAGLRYSDGLGMLVAQAARSFELWTGRRPDGPAVLVELRGPASRTQ